MTPLGTRLEMALKHAEINQNALVKAFGFSRAYMSQLKSGVQPGHTWWPRIAEKLSVPIEWLLENKNPPSWAVEDPLSPYNSLITPQLALVGHTSAGPGEIFEEFPEPLAFPVPIDWVVVRVDGDSAYPVVYAGQFVILDTLRTQSAATLDAAAIRDLHNNMCMVRTNDGKSLLKRLCEAIGSPDGFTLGSINSGLGSPWIARNQIDTITPVVGVIYEDPTQERRKGRVSAPQHKKVNRK